MGSSQSGSVEEKSETICADEKFTTRAEAEKMWTEISRSVNILSAELAENLRLILEPQRASKMQYVCFSEVYFFFLEVITALENA